MKGKKLGITTGKTSGRTPGKTSGITSGKTSGRTPGKTSGITSGKTSGKILLKPSTLLNPVPVVMVACSSKEKKANIITIAWAGTINSEPPMLSISIRKERYSWAIIKESMCFSVNLPDKKLVKSLDYCGVKSGRDSDKFRETGLTPVASEKITAPIIKECPVNLECEVRQIVELGSHDLFIAEIVSVSADEKLLNEKGKLCLEKADLLCYMHGEYRTTGKAAGYFGFSVRKKPE